MRLNQKTCAASPAMRCCAASLILGFAATAAFALEFRTPEFRRPASPATRRSAGKPQHRPVAPSTHRLVSTHRPALPEQRLKSESVDQPVVNNPHTRAAPSTHNLAATVDTPTGHSSPQAGPQGQTATVPVPMPGPKDGGPYWEYDDVNSHTSACQCGDCCAATGTTCGICGGYGDTCGCRPLPPRSGIVASAWLAQGFTLNVDDPANGSNLPVTFNDRANDYQMNQLYLALERPVDTCRPVWDIGGRFDLLYGTDYFFTTATGLETHRDGSPRWNSSDGPRAGGAALYGLAMPQLYAEVFAPIGTGLNVKLGHFYTILGYESVMYPCNFFYSHSYAKQYGEPFTHTGLLADYKLSPTWTVYSGFTRGWDSWEDLNGQLGYLGGLQWRRPDGGESLSFILHTGNEDDAGQNNRTVYSMVYCRRLQPCVTYTLEHVFGTEANAALQGDQRTNAKWYGIAQYLVCQVDPSTQLGMRVEWFRDEENARVLGIPLDGAEGGNYVALTMGANYRPMFYDRLEIRPELRWDWSDTRFPALGVQGMFDDFTADSQLTLALSAVAHF